MWCTDCVHSVLLTQSPSDGCVCVFVCMVSRLETRSEEGAVYLLKEERQAGSEGSTARRFSGRDVCLPSWRGTVTVTSVSSRHVTVYHRLIEIHHNSGMMSNEQVSLGFLSNIPSCVT